MMARSAASADGRVLHRVSQAEAQHAVLAASTLLGVAGSVWELEGAVVAGGQLGFGIALEELELLEGPHLGHLVVRVGRAVGVQLGVPN